MKLVFLGTRGYIEARTERHFRHTSLLLSYLRKRILIDCGEDWAETKQSLKPHAIVVTHGHPDHAGGLRDGAPCPVHAPEAAWALMNDFPIADRKVIRLRRKVKIHGVAFEAFPVEHSTRAPAVGYRVTAGSVTIFYVPDVAYIPEREAALSGIRVYIGDGATITRPLIRKTGNALIGHAPIRTQLTWCEKEGVGRAIFTHCGSEIVTGDEKTLVERVRQLARERGVDSEVAYDGMERVFR